LSPSTGPTSSIPSTSSRSTKRAARLAILERENLVENARITGAYLLERPQKSFGDSAIVGELRGIGMLAALEIVRDRETREPFPNPDPG
jgi:4-aminobutyrate aminotransferase-like enzyme